MDRNKKGQANSDIQWAVRSLYEVHEIWDCSTYCKTTHTHTNKILFLVFISHPGVLDGTLKIFQAVYKVTWCKYSVMNYKEHMLRFSCISNFVINREPE